jgi:predicted DNA-binding transcriptional regulator AlpA
VKDVKSPQVAVAAKAAKRKASKPPAVRLLDKHEILAITGASFPTVWTWMCAGTFPRARIVGGKSKWRSDEVEAWIADLPVRALKGDAKVEVG